MSDELEGVCRCRPELRRARNRSACAPRICSRPGSRQLGRGLQSPGAARGGRCLSSHQPRACPPLFPTKSAFAGRSASSKARSSGEPGAAGRGYEHSGRGCRRRCSCRRKSSAPPSGERCAAPASAASLSSRTSLSLVDKRVREIRAFRSFGPNRAIETAQVIEELIALAREMRQANARGEELGLSEEELAFYDALEVNDSAVRVLGEPTLTKIARELVATVRKNATIDWTVRDKMRVSAGQAGASYTDRVGAGRGSVAGLGGGLNGSIHPTPALRGLRRPQMYDGFPRCA